ncbi:MAG: hypothetical protein HY881_10445 [Deltaproteobacteria bacterium]|nr:hypothetical protein [Deltaproteobacteria bacterium]
MNLMTLLKHVCRRLPIVGSVHMCTLSDFGEACKELFISLLISMSPVYVGAFVLYIVQSGSTSIGYLSCAGTIVQNGELFIYAAAVLAPAVYIASKDRYDVRSFPSKFTFIGCAILVAILSTSIFTIERVKAQVLPHNVLLMSVTVFVVAVLVFYFALVYNNTLLPNPATVMRDNEQDFTRRVQSHREASQGGN